jgi:Flp pilus assembly protein TadD
MVAKKSVDDIPMAVLLDNSPAIPESIPLALPEPSSAELAKYEAAAKLLDRAAQGSSADPSVLYMLAMAYKRLGKGVEARTALRRIQRPDASVMLQMALLSLEDHQLAQAEGELQRARQLDPKSFPICYNLLLTQLTLGKHAEAVALISEAIELAKGPKPRGTVQDNPTEDARFLEILRALLKSAQKERDGVVPDTMLCEITPTEEVRLLSVLRGLGHLELVYSLLRTLSEARPRSGAVRDAYIEALLVKGKELIDKCHWTEAELLLRPVLKERGIARKLQVSLLNLLGCCACLTQDFESAARHFQAAVKQAPQDARLEQNLALTFELNGELTSADPHWNRYFDLLSDASPPAPSDIPHYLDALAYESLTRLAGRFAEKEKWQSAITYMQRATQIRSGDPETLERLFQLYVAAKKPSDGRKTLEQLRRLRPNEPQYDLYELDLIEVKGINDLEKLLNEISRIRDNYPTDSRVEERATSMVSNVIPVLVSHCDMLTDQMTKVIDQVRHLPNFQINWPAVREVMRDLLREFQKLRRITGKCLQLVSNDEQRRMVRDLADHIEKKMEACRSMGA